MKFIKEKVIDGVVQRDFRVEVDGESVPCVLWSHGDAPPAPTLLCMGHGGSQHKKTASLRARAVDYAKRFGWATLAIDAAGHGDRISREEAARFSRAVGARVTGQVRGGTADASRLKGLTEAFKRGVPEWKAALDATLSLSQVDSDAAIGYWGVSMGTAIGVPFVAQEPRIRCAVFGLAGATPNWPALSDFAGRIQIPLQFVFQWDDAVAPRELGIALFDAFGSKDKTMHINPGGHLEIPAFESEAWRAFFLRHLVVAADRASSAA